MTKLFTACFDVCLSRSKLHQHQQAGAREGQQAGMEVAVGQVSLLRAVVIVVMVVMVMIMMIIVMLMMVRMGDSSFVGVSGEVD